MAKNGKKSGIKFVPLSHAHLLTMTLEEQLEAEEERVIRESWLEEQEKKQERLQRIVDKGDAIVERLIESGKPVHFRFYAAKNREIYRLVRGGSETRAIAKRYGKPQKWVIKRCEDYRSWLVKIQQWHANIDNAALGRLMAYPETSGIRSSTQLADLINAFEVKPKDFGGHFTEPVYRSLCESCGIDPEPLLRSLRDAAATKKAEAVYSALLKRIRRSMRNDQPA